VLEERVLLAAPVAQDDAVATDEDTVLMGDLLADNGSGADSDPESDPLTVSAVNGNAAAVGTMITLASGAKLTVNASGTFTYDPFGAFDDLTLGQSAMDTFTYRITDGTFSSGTATVTVTISGVNSPPAINADMFQIGKFTVLNGDVFANDTDGDADALTVTAVNGSGAAVGTTITLASGSTLQVLSGGSFIYRAGGNLKRLEVGETGFDSFTYSAADGHGGSGTATVTIRVSGEGLDDLVGYHLGTWQIGRSTGSAFATSTTITGNVAWDGLVYGDFNADGLTDVVGFIDGEWRVGVSNGSGFTFSTWATWSDLPWTNFTVGDVNGDGRDDILARINASWWVALSDGTSFGTATRWGTWSNQAWQHVTLTDLNKDGNADLLAYITGGWYAAISNGANAFGAATRWAKWSDLPWTGIGTFDFNNDGRTDIYGMYAGTWFVGQSNGTSFSTVLRAQWSPLVVWRDIRTGDFNGDGKDDIAARTGGTWWVGYSGNKAGGVGGATATWARWTDLAWVDVTVGDFDGDGRDDIAGRFAGEWWVSRTGTSTILTSKWATWNDVPWQAVTAADFDGTLPSAQFSAASRSALWSQLADDAEFAALLLAS
jgi:VCBS repeat-containing protein